MKIAIFVETYVPLINGVVTHVKVLKEGLEALGHEVLVVFADITAKHHYIQDHVLHCPAKELKHIYHFGLASPLSRTRMRMLRAFNPDVIHIHTEWGIGRSGLHIAKRLQVPVVYTLHTMYDDYVYYVAAPWWEDLAKRLMHGYLKPFIQSASEITGPSVKCQYYLDQAQSDLKVHVIANSVEVERFNREQFTAADRAALRRRYGIPEGATVACFVGRLAREKSVDVLLQYWAHTLCQDDGLHLMIIGGGPDLDALRRQADGLGLSTMVTFTDMVPHEAVPLHLASSDLYLTTSLSEAYSMSMLEAMAAGLPVLQRLDELNQEQIVDGVNGYKFRTEEEMAGYLRQFRRLTPEAWAAFRRSTVDSVKALGDERLARELLQVYESAIALNAAPPSPTSPSI
jgi:1,2-diacylglycerol 3-alpha-glucosyltransferase